LTASTTITIFPKIKKEVDMKYKIGICQFEPKLLDLEYNRNKMQEMVDGVEADLIVFPELATGGYVFKDMQEVRSVSEPFKTG
jgi:predicted amidohydrolase